MRADLRSRLRAFVSRASCSMSGVTGVAGVTGQTRAISPEARSLSHPAVVGRCDRKDQSSQCVTPASPVTPVAQQGEHALACSHTFGGVTGHVMVATCTADDWHAAFDERAGFLEFDCHLSRAEAETQAFADTTARLGPPPVTMH